MSDSKQLYEAIRTYHSSVKELGLAAEVLEKSAIGCIKRTLNSDAFKNHFGEKNPADYDEFDTAVLSMCAELMDVIERSKSGEKHSKSVREYSNVLKLMAKG
ncbi:MULTISPECIES: hypothetical protein [Vibrio]|uniref:hypothetical protein n=1 Tax=Vibrio TaxID=662 RepID=UPI000543279D|nr:MULTISPECIES: hypothetical protein [Vibrio]MDW1810521.1 hypothetical protein [Vibrio sp. Vb2362]EGR3356002.1 hypothetical protein [Vibrio parahaemolyticus]EHV5548574.1 hypothetical protein [Vibrio parahaemolyticus]EJG1852746.1 hypothetical protein [Vibrio parahaemolyticus]KHF15884.1 hypothetical protein PO80_09140 [Vibrio parahaemolyticus]